MEQIVTLRSFTGFFEKNGSGKYVFLVFAATVSEVCFSLGRICM